MTPLDIARYTDQADDWLSFACGYSRGRLVTDRVVETVTEGRCSVPSYSSCGDLPNYMLFRLGVRAPAVNRAENGGWRVGKNFDIFWSPKPARAAIPGETYQCGDMLCIWKTGTDAHALVVIEHTPSDRVILTAEYGQKWQGEQLTGKNIHPDGKLCVHQYSDRPDGLMWIGSRAVKRVLPLIDMIDHCTALGQIVAAEDPPQLHDDGSSRYPDGRTA
jgi:hypothetical protein